MTGYGRGQDRAKALEAGFDTFVTKPLGVDKVRELITSAHRRHERTTAEARG